MKQSAQQLSPNKKIIISVVGTIGSGKDTVSDYIAENYGFSAYSTSDEIRKEAASRGLGEERATLHDIANELRNKFGADILSKRAIASAKNKNKILITSIRNPDEFKPLKDAEGKFSIISVDAPGEIRYRRILSRARANEESLTFRAFEEAEAADNNIGNEGAQKIKETISMADYSIINDADLETLHKRIDGIMSIILKK